VTITTAISIGMLIKNTSMKTISDPEVPPLIDRIGSDATG
jgi:hypothetical protein